MKLHVNVINCINRVLLQALEDQDTLPLLKAEAPNVMRRCFTIMKTTSLAKSLIDEVRCMAFTFFYNVVVDLQFQRDGHL